VPAGACPGRLRGDAGARAEPPDADEIEEQTLAPTEEDRYSPAVVRRLPGPSWLEARRLEALERFAGASLPTSADELWRYSRIEDLDLQLFAPAVPPPLAPATGDGELAFPPVVARVREAAGPSATVVVTVDGALASVRGRRDDGGRPGPVVSRLGELPGVEEHFGALVPHVDAFVELAGAFAPDPVVVRVPRGLELEAPIVVVHLFGGTRPAQPGAGDGPSSRGEGAAATAAAYFPWTLVVLEEGSRAEVVECAASGPGPSLVVAVTELAVGAHAGLGYETVQVLGEQTWQLAYQASEVAAGGSLHSSTLALGGDYARLRSDSRLVGARASGRVDAAFLGSGRQVLDFRTLEEHVGARTESDLLFKGAVRDEARSVYSGLIRIHRGARGANAFQTNRNLVLSDRARADSVPNLDIEENDVRCSHASAVGPIDADQRFYLESRGVPPDAAERLILLGFLDEVLVRTPVERTRSTLRELVRDRLSSAGRREEDGRSSGGPSVPAGVREGQRGEEES
jgi:Fe-S cluster assembly protein SufD